MSRRVVVTGVGAVTSLGSDFQSVRACMEAGRNGIRRMDAWAIYEGLNTLLGGPVLDFQLPPHFTRKRIRAMGRTAQLAAVATESALDRAGLLGDAVISDGRTGIAYGSSSGSTEPVHAFGTMLRDHNTRGINATTYIRMMSHTSAVNTAMFFGVKGRVIATSTACTSGSQGIGYAYEAIAHGKQTVMIAGGSEELCPTQAAVFDTLFATSTMNDRPGATPRPFDAQRDGLVIGEGACTFILEELEFARSRGATILAELVGYGTNCDAQHVTQPSAQTMEVAMRLALADAELDPAAVGFVCAHGTATELGDIAESHATRAVFGERIAISAPKSYFGHTLGACGSLESWLAIEMMDSDWFAPTLNLSSPDPLCASLDYIMGSARRIETEYVMNNNFAFGGINTSLIFRRWH
jgi:3-oxoacyl-[acyl-carrier-protein] synthase II